MPVSHHLLNPIGMKMERMHWLRSLLAGLGLITQLYQTVTFIKKSKIKCFTLNMYIQRAKPSKSVQNIQCTHTKVHKYTEMQYKYGQTFINTQSTMYTVHIQRCTNTHHRNTHSSACTLYMLNCAYCTRMHRPRWWWGGM